MLAMKHTAGLHPFTNYWTWTFDIEPDSNKLTGTSIGSSSTSAETYTYDSRGNLIDGLNHLDGMTYHALVSTPSCQ